MMMFELLPFFLAAQIDNNVTWTHGPEYIFHGQVKMITSLDKDKGEPLGTGLYLKLKCRPGDTRNLRCHMEDTKITRLKPQAFDVDHAEPDTDDNYRPTNVIKVPFEVTFNDNGIDKYIVEQTEPPVSTWSLNMMKLIVNQLSIGTDLSDEMKLTYRALENFTIGECDTSFHVTRRPMKDTKKDVPGFELMPLAKLGKFTDESIEVEKKRSMQDCLRCVEPFFGTRYVLGLVLRDVLTKMKTSESKIFISKHKFVTETTNESDLYDVNRKKLGKVLDHMKLTLESIVPAKSEAEKKFTKPLSVGLLPSKEHNNAAGC